MVPLRICYDAVTAGALPRYRVPAHIPHVGIRYHLVCTEHSPDVCTAVYSELAVLRQGEQGLELLRIPKERPQSIFERLFRRTRILTGVIGRGVYVFSPVDATDLATWHFDPSIMQLPRATAAEYLLQNLYPPTPSIAVEL